MNSSILLFLFSSRGLRSSSRTHVCTIGWLFQELLSDVLPKLARYPVAGPRSPALPELLVPGPAGPWGLCVPWSTSVLPQTTFSHSPEIQLCSGNLLKDPLQVFPMSKHALFPYIPVRSSVSMQAITSLSLQDVLRLFLQWPAWMGVPPWALN